MKIGACTYISSSFLSRPQYQYAGIYAYALRVFLLFSPTSYIPFYAATGTLLGSDHLLGHLKAVNPSIDGCDETCSQPLQPQNASSSRVPTNYDAVDGGPDDPCHSFDCITQQIYGFAKPMGDKTSPVKMDGFVANALAENGNVNFVMSAFNSTNLPVLSSLALEFAVFDHWQ